MYGFGGRRFNPLLLALLALTAGCSSVRTLVNAPSIYAAGRPYPAADIPAALQTPEADILYVSDRRRTNAADGRIEYDEERSRSMAFGAARIRMGVDETWRSIVEASSKKERDRKITLAIEDVAEIGRFPATPLSFSVIEGELVVDEDVAASYEQSTLALRNELVRRLERAESREVIMFIQGFNADFDDAAFDISEVWHFAGRFAVPVSYSWPSGAGGFLGYFKDRESGEFTIYHLKELLRILAATPEIERIHIIAHSRGTAAATTALRELVIEIRGAGRDPREVLRVENLIMAAPDLDFGVVEQRLIAEKFGPAIGQITIYTSDKDGALGFAQWLLRGTRFGRLKADDLTEVDRQIFSKVKNVNFVEVEDPPGFFGHSYYRRDPGALSDIITLIRERTRPDHPTRNLEHVRGNFWRLPKKD